MEDTILEELGTEHRKKKKPKTRPPLLTALEITVPPFRREWRDLLVSPNPAD